MTLVTGNLYKIEKKRVSIGTLKNLKAQVNIVAEQTTVSTAKQQALEETKDYHVAGLGQEDVPMNSTTMVMTASNLRLLPSDSSLENIESRMTSVSLSGKQKKKVAAV